MSSGENSFEERLKSIRETIDAIEGGKLPLEESVKQYEEGMKSLEKLEAELTEMKRKITVIREGAEGGPKEEPFNPDGGN